MFFSMGLFTSFACADEPLTAGKTTYDFSVFYAGNLYPIPEGNGWKFLDIEGETVNETVYDNYVAHNGNYTQEFRYYYAKKDGQWYRLSSTGKALPVKLPNDYDLIFDLGQGLYVLRNIDAKKTSLRLYNSNTNTIFSEEFDTLPISYQGDGLIPIGKFKRNENNSQGEFQFKGVDMNLFDLVSGKKLLPDNEKYKTIHISEGFINITMEGENENYSYLVNRNGEEISLLPKGVKGVSRFQNGVAQCYFINKEKGIGLLDRSGRVLCEGYSSICDNFDGLSRVIRGKKDNEDIYLINNESRFGYINAFGNEVISCQYRDASDFRNGLALVQKENFRIFLINTYGDEITELSHLPKMTWFLNTLWRKGIYSIKEEDDFKVFNINGKLLWETDKQEIIKTLPNTYTNWF
jgi:hypothetical protein